MYILYLEGKKDKIKKMKYIPMERYMMDHFLSIICLVPPLTVQCLYKELVRLYVFFLVFTFLTFALPFGCRL